MSQTLTNRGKDAIMDAWLASGIDLRVGLLTTLAGHGNVPDLNFVSEMEAHADFAELTTGAVPSYARQALTGETSTEDDTDDRAEVDAGDVAFGALEAGATIVGCFIYDHNGGADSARVLYGIYDLTSTPTNGGTYTININEFLRGQ